MDLLFFKQADLHFRAVNSAFLAGEGRIDPGQNLDAGGGPQTI